MIMRITYLVRGVESNFKRIGDHLETVTLFNTWKSGGLLYGFRDRFNVMSIAIEDIRKIEPAI
jgi:hypothetical protein